MSSLPRQFDSDECDQVHVWFLEGSEAEAKRRLTEEEWNSTLQLIADGVRSAKVITPGVEIPLKQLKLFNMKVDLFHLELSDIQLILVQRIIFEGDGDDNNDPPGGGDTIKKAMISGAIGAVIREALQEAIKHCPDVFKLFGIQSIDTVAGIRITHCGSVSITRKPSAARVGARMFHTNHSGPLITVLFVRFMNLASLFVDEGIDQASHLGGTVGTPAHAFGVRKDFDRVLDLDDTVADPPRVFGARKDYGRALHLDGTVADQSHAFGARKDFDRVLDLDDTVADPPRVFGVRKDYGRALHLDGTVADQSHAFGVCEDLDRVLDITVADPARIFGGRKDCGRALSIGSTVAGQSHAFGVREDFDRVLDRKFSMVTVGRHASGKSSCLTAIFMLHCKREYKQQIGSKLYATDVDQDHAYNRIGSDKISYSCKTLATTASRASKYSSTLVNIKASHQNHDNKLAELPMHSFMLSIPNERGYVPSAEDDAHCAERTPKSETRSGVLVNVKMSGKKSIDPAAHRALRVKVSDDANTFKASVSACATITRTVDVRATREKLGLTQEQFADSFGLSVASLRNWEQGARVPERPIALYLRLIEKFPEQVKEEVAILRAAEAKKL